jgi:hypothetical protein
MKEAWCMKGGGKHDGKREGTAWEGAEEKHEEAWCMKGKARR